MFSLAKDLSECKVVRSSFTKYLKKLENQVKINKLLDEAMELTENAGFGDIEH
jgi:heme oxygenase